MISHPGDLPALYVKIEKGSAVDDHGYGCFTVETRVPDPRSILAQGRGSRRFTSGGNGSPILLCLPRYESCTDPHLHRKMDNHGSPVVAVRWRIKGIAALRPGPALPAPLPLNARAAPGDAALHTSQAIHFTAVNTAAASSARADLVPQNCKSRSGSG